MYGTKSKRVRDVYINKINGNGGVEYCVENGHQFVGRANYRF